MSDLPPPSPSAGSPASPVVPPSKVKRPLWKRWWVITLAVVVALVVVASIANSGKKSGESDATAAPGVSTVGSIAASSPITESAAPATGASASQPATAAPTTEGATTTSSGSSGNAVIGTTIDTGSGGVARVNGVTPNAPPRNQFDTPDPGFSFSEAEVEVCAGKGGQSVNPLYWKAFLADNTEAKASLTSDFQTFEVAPGGCTRGSVAFSVPDGAAIADVVLTDTLLSEVARWDASSATPTSGPLTPSTQVQASAVGGTAELAGGANAVVRTVTPNAPPTNQFATPAPGHQLVEIDVQVCAGSESLPVNPLYWLVTAQDNYTGSAAVGGGTLGALDVASGQCVAGTVQIEIPEQSVPAFVVLTDAGLNEIGRWAV